MAAWRAGTPLLPVLALLALATVGRGEHGRRLLISFRYTDDQGVLCPAADLDHRTACCLRGVKFSCDSCNPVDDCCESYEACVSCCLKPGHGAQQRLAEVFRVPNRQDSGHWTDTFELCAAVCRTHKTSTAHENAYISPRHHCFSNLGKPLLSPPLPPHALDGVTVILGAAGQSCDEACMAAVAGAGGAASCSARHLPLLDTCDRLREHSACEAGCIVEASQIVTPFYASPATPKAERPALCIAGGPSARNRSCAAQETHMHRLCPCLLPARGASAPAMGAAQAQPPTGQARHGAADAQPADAKVKPAAESGTAVATVQPAVAVAQPEARPAASAAPAAAAGAQPEAQPVAAEAQSAGAASPALTRPLSPPPPADQAHQGSHDAGDAPPAQPASLPAAAEAQGNGATSPKLPPKPPSPQVQADSVPTLVAAAEEAVEAEEALADAYAMVIDASKDVGPRSEPEKRGDPAAALFTDDDAETEVSQMLEEEQRKTSKGQRHHGQQHPPPDGQRTHASEHGAHTHAKQPAAREEEHEHAHKHVTAQLTQQHPEQQQQQQQQQQQKQKQRPQPDKQKQKDKLKGKSRKKPAQQHSKPERARSDARAQHDAPPAASNGDAARANRGAGKAHLVEVAQAT